MNELEKFYGTKEDYDNVQNEINELRNTIIALGRKYADILELKLTYDRFDDIDLETKSIDDEKHILLMRLSLLAHKISNYQEIDKLNDEDLIDIGDIVTYERKNGDLSEIYTGKLVSSADNIEEYSDIITINGPIGQILYKNSVSDTVFPVTIDGINYNIIILNKQPTFESEAIL